LKFDFLLMLKKQLINFLIVGMINTIVGYSLYVFFIYLGVNYALAIFFSTILGVLFNFKTIGKFVFENDDNSLLTKFFLAYVITFAINVSIVFKLRNFGYDDYTAGLIAIIISAIISFVLTKYLVFKK